MLIALNKPYGVICQFSPHEKHRSLKDFVPVPNVYPAGRLDTDSEGLLLLTDDGRQQARIANPRFKLTKTYWAQLEGSPDDERLALLQQPLDLGDFVAQPATVNYHIWLLMQSGLIVGVCNHDYPRNGFVCYGVCLTWQGQEFLAEIRDDTRWRKIRAVLAEKSLDLSLEAVKAAAAWVLKNVF